MKVVVNYPKNKKKPRGVNVFVHLLFPSEPFVGQFHLPCLELSLLFIFCSKSQMVTLLKFDGPFY